jgi:hypothetical protein
MIEKCPARAVEPSVYSEVITEANIPEACMRCIQGALEDPAASVVTVDTYDEALAFAREHVDGPDVPADDFNSWMATTMEPPREGLGRRALVENGFDLGLGIGSQSYEDGSETQVTTLEFECYVEADR